MEKSILIRRVYQNLYQNQSKLIVTPLCRFYEAKVTREPFLNGTSSNYIEDMYQAWLKDTQSVHASWDSFFRRSIKGKGPAYQAPPSLAPSGKNQLPLYFIMPIIQEQAAAIATQKPTQLPGISDSAVEKILDEHMAVESIIRSFQTRGHLGAKLDPLNIKKAAINQYIYKDEKDRFMIVKDIIDDLKASTMDQVYRLPQATYIGGDKRSLTFREILKRLERIYCHHIGVEYMHLNSKKECEWLKKKLELEDPKHLVKEEKQTLLHRIIRSTGFEAFLHKKWPSEKRFGLEGCEILIPALKQVIDQSTSFGVNSVIIGMPHRGRLNVLANVCRKPLSQIFTQFATLEAEDTGSGDVKYHLGTYIERLNRVSNKHMRLAVVANPSHLEAVDPVVQGKTRAEQFYKGDLDGKQTMSILLHGDASFSGQGVVYETMHLSNLPDYTTHGTIHFVVNNQIGFTTDPRFSRSSPYCTDVARVVNIPIFHVNADDAESVMYICNIASNWRAKFRKDCVIDLVCYRRFGHNEADEPMFTQPLMYKIIKKKKPIIDIYSEQLIKDKVITREEIKAIEKGYEDICEKSFQKAKTKTSLRYKDWLDSKWSGFFKNPDITKYKNTCVDEQILMKIGAAMSQLPNITGFVAHKGIERILKGRADMLKARSVDWALGEGMAFGSLLKEGIHVRLSGQDVERGTFSHRHHVLRDQEKDGVTFCPLNNIFAGQAKYIVCNSSLSEYAVLGFEVGYSLTSPNTLVIWEAQFGDFNNVAQCVIDQFISSGESKWIRQSGIVLSQPHGLEGMGPEHSSARVERFLQMCSDDPDTCPPDSNDFELKQLIQCNWIIANCTTPANIFHILRRQIYLPVRKPLIHMSPKSLLRHPEARSSLDEMISGRGFQRIYSEMGPAMKNESNVKKLVFCSGKVYYNLKKHRDSNGLTEIIAIIRLEQISPFPYDLIKKECAKYSNAKLLWVQEEHKNQGCWSYVQPRFATALKKTREISYIGRSVSPSPATGSKAQHLKEHEALLSDFIAL